MTKLTSLLFQFALLVVALIYSAYMQSHLPAVVPTHWGINGKPDAFGSPAFSLWLMPGTILFITVLTLVLPVLSPKKYDMERFAKTYYYAMALVAMLMAGMHVAILYATAGGKFDMTRMIFAILFAFFALIGNVFGKVKQNFYMGVRTPWTIADSRVWDKTHREAGHLWIGGGAIGLILALVGVPSPALIGLLLAIAFIPIYRSWWWYQKLVVKGEAA